MKAPLATALRALVRQGANLELSAAQVDFSLAVDLIRLGGVSHFVFLDADHYSPSGLEQLASLGHSRVTFRFSAPESEPKAPS
jgi:hypothetical protein